MIYHYYTNGKRLLKSGYYCDENRHVVCLPYSISGLHAMACAMQLKRCWFHRDHYDMPKRRIAEITSYCTVVSTKEIVNIKNGKYGKQWTK